MEHPTHALKNDLGQVKSLPNSKSRRPAGARKRGRPGSHLYLKSNVYYFRYVFVEPYAERIGRSEIRLSLRTGYARKAKCLVLPELLWVNDLVRSLLTEDADERHRTLRADSWSQSPLVC